MPRREQLQQPTSYWQSRAIEIGCDAWDLGFGIWDLLMRQRVQHGIDAERVPIWTEIHEVRRIVALALPRIAEIRVVRHQDDHAALLVDDAARVGRRAVGAAFRRAPGAEKEIDRRNLRDFLDLELCVEHRMVERQIEDRKFGRWQCLPQLAHPPAPRVLAPEVISPQKAALFEVKTQLRSFVVVEADPAWLGHHDERTIEERRIGQLNEQMFRFARLILADVGLGELGQTEREINVGARIIDAPASAVALEGIAKNDAAEVKAAVEILRRRGTRAEAEPAASAKLRVGGHRHTEQRRKKQHR